MKSMELLPTDENLIETLKKNLLDRNKELTSFFKLLSYQTGISTIAVDGRWGSGKTFFVKQLQLLINAYNPSFDMEEENQTTIKTAIPVSEDFQEHCDCLLAVYYDAWENDSDTDPIISIIFEIAKQLGIDYKIDNKNYYRIAGSIIEAISGRNITGVLDALKDDNPLSSLQQKKSMEESLRQFLSQCLEERGNRLVIFIDELDRCKPSYAVKLLEEVKHYLNDDRITFVFSTNINELQHTIKHYYGNKFDACRYLDKFFDMRIALPPADLRRFYESISMNGSYVYEITCRRVVEVLNLELREITRFYNQARVAAYKPTHSENHGYDFSFPDGKAKQFILFYIVPLLIGLGIVDVTQYDSFINGLNPKPMHKLFDSEEIREYVFCRLLSHDESLNSEEGKTLVTKNELIERVYNAIFVEKYKGQKYSTVVGDYSFDSSSRDYAISVASMLSRYADYK